MTSTMNATERRKRQLEDTIDVHFQDIRKSFGAFDVLKGINLEIRRGEFFSLLGPSGCGKTTLLRILAGFEFADSGGVFLRGQDVAKLPPNQRSVNTVFQNYALFPHMTVAENVGFGLKMRKQTEIKSKVDTALEMVEITQFATRKPNQLSGGQRQRVALARALVNEPQVVLLDEPLSALDRKLRQSLQVELMRLQSRLGLTFIFVTHDQEEALTMSDRLAVMNKGQIEQLGVAEEMYERPATPFVAKFLGSSNLITGTVIGPNKLSTPFGELEVQDPLPKSGEVQVSLRPEKVQLSRTGFGAMPNQVVATITDEIYSGAENEYRLHCAGDLELSAEVMNSGLEHHDFEPGERVIAYLPPERLVVLGGAKLSDLDLEGH